MELLFGVHLARLVLLMHMLKGTLSLKHCTMSTNKLTCTYDMDEYKSLSVETSDIKTLDLSNIIITELNRPYLKAYTNLEELNLSHCRIKSIENGTFADLYKLIKLNLSDNLMTTFGADTFETLNALNVLILSNNLLANLDTFTSDKFPKLIALDVSGNNLKYLPQSIISRITDNPPFSVYGNFNPWDCNDRRWKHTLERNRHLSNLFCNKYRKTNLTYNPHMNLNADKEKTVVIKQTKIRENCGFLTCKWWIVGSIWIGIILGNVNRLNSLLYQLRCRKKRILGKCVGTEADPSHQVKQEKLAVSLEEAEKHKIYQKI